MPLTRITTQFISYPASGSVANTSSWANNVNYTDVRNINSSSSFAGTASYAITSSYSTKSETLLSGANINAGQITASAISVTTLNVVTVTSSIDYASGSNVFGTKSTDTQQFTGSVSITGSLTVNGSITGTSSYSTIAGTASYSALAQTASYIANAVSASYALTASYASNVPATSSWSIQAQTASYVANAISSSYALTASYAANVPASSSWSVQAQTASYVINAISASYSGTASYALNGGGTSLVTGSTYNITSSWALNAVSSSYALYALNAGSSGTASLLTAQTFAVSGSSQTIFTLIQPVADVDQVLVTVSGILQSRSGSYTVSASTLTFSAVVPSGSLVDVRFLNASGLAGPSLTSSYAATASYVVSAFTASYVTTAQTASYVIMAQTASYVLLAKSASYVLNAVSASYSTTASYALNALSASYAPNTYVLPSNVVSASAQLSNGGGTSFTNSNNITVGQVTASAISVTTLSVVTITSSVDYASGSNIFGTKSTDTQLFTGSVAMTGSLSVNGAITGTTTIKVGTSSTFGGTVSQLNGANVVQANGTGMVSIATTDSVAVDKGGSLALGAKATGGAETNPYPMAVLSGRTENISNLSGYFAIATSNSSGTVAEKMRINSLGDAGIGVTSPIAATVGGSLTTAGIIAARGILAAHQTSAAIIQHNSDVCSLRAYGATSGSGFWTFNVGGGGNSPDAEAMRLDSSGRLGIGTTNPSSFGKLAVLTTGTSTGIALVNGSGASASNTVSTDYYLPDTNTGLSLVASIGVINPAAGANRYGQIYFSTSFAGAPTERMRIDNSGNVGIGTSSPSYKLDIQGGGLGTTIGTATSIRIGSSFDVNPAADTVLLRSEIDSATSGDRGSAFVVHTTRQGVGTTEKFRIGSNGNVGIGTASPAQRLHVQSGTATVTPITTTSVTGDTAYQAILVTKFDNDSTTSQNFIQFQINNGGANCGKITANGANTAAFGSTSDRRVKENIADLPSQLANIMALRPVEFDYVESHGGGHQIGFVAQEMQQVYPDVISTDDSSEKIMSITGWSKTEARLVKAIQELKADNDSLRARIAALESK